MKTFPNCIKLLYLVLLCLIILIIYIFSGIQIKNVNIKEIVQRAIAKPGPISCYRLGGRSLPDISEAKSVKDKSIFFLETSCNSYKNDKIILQPRQACAVESAALNNPDYNVYLLFVSSGIIKDEDDESDRILKAMLTYKNVHLHHLDYAKYTNGTPVENLYKERKVEESKYSQSHASDVLRYLTMWKYGGVYLDLDVISLKSLSDLPANFAALEDSSTVGSAILAFSSNNSGHEFAQMCLEDLKDNFRGDVWIHNGPGVITRLLTKLCEVQSSNEMVTRNCRGFKVFSPEKFYPVHYNYWQTYFDIKSIDFIKEVTNNSYFMHIWNNLSGATKIPITTEVPYTMFAKKFCPKVFAECKELF
ncbi:hypothetical protein FQR65_LT13208 [Abscondita terminalis]|nr:hypothetical protein FQR65_LT13208 [Abscondita terminalis]